MSGIDNGSLFCYNTTQYGAFEKNKKIFIFLKLIAENAVYIDIRAFSEPDSSVREQEYCAEEVYDETGCSGLGRPACIG